MPADVALQEADLSLDANYLKPTGGSATFVLSIDGYPVAARAPDQTNGSFGIKLGVDGAPRKSGFIRLGLAWNARIGADECGDWLAGNVVEISPDAHITYRYDPSAVDDLLTAWTALPSTTSVLIAGRALGAEAYDAAWRVGVALERAGKQVRFVGLPAVGDTVSLDGLSVPPPLAEVPAFAALSGKGAHPLANTAEVGAYLVLAGGSLADVAVADPALQVQIGAAFDALASEVAAHGTATATAFDRLRKTADTLATPAKTANEIGLATLGGEPVIAVAAGAAGKTEALFSGFWRQLAVARSLTVNAVNIPRNDSNAVSLTTFSNTANSIDVLATSDWSARFSLADLSTDGRLPSHLVIDVAAAPGASNYDPVATVFLNDYLVAAKRLYADGRPERIEADLPDYAIRPMNVLRVTFKRQPAGDRCSPIAQAYPVAVLPTSTLTLAASKPHSNFISVVPRLTAASQLLLPTSYLTDAPETLQNVVRIADSAGLSPQRATLMLVKKPDNGPQRARRPMRRSWRSMSPCRSNRALM